MSWLPRLLTDVPHTHFHSAGAGPCTASATPALLDASGICIRTQTSVLQLCIPAQAPGVASNPAECQPFLEMGGGPRCGPGAGGVTCGDRLATFITFLRSGLSGASGVACVGDKARQMHQLQVRVVR